MKHTHGWWIFGESNDAPPLTVMTVIYPSRSFEDQEDTGMYNNSEMISRSWEALNTEFTTRWSPSVTDSTLNFGTMLAPATRPFGPPTQKDCWIH